ncbi:hypothetical protein [Adhaeribacter pallidiroseus]|uniref:Uncharacterized protein n=1 Tax=Adhaeribacter pallidiroseus TaxID=2072847 RepID=A0A369QEG0_9BACT|nr:hypothetical protein [Adhaeribacter pallidiroseus]RDC63313.1 hypothetical protein AHMF7616_01915 [Adhaeribacter pallidiroseus]
MDDNRMYEVMVEMLAEQRITNQKLASLEEAQIKHSLELQMLNRSMLKISDQLNHFAEHETRIRHIDNILKIA